MHAHRQQIANEPGKTNDPTPPQDEQLKADPSPGQRKITGPRLYNMEHVAKKWRPLLL